jgi:hypothetical protein
MKAICRDSISNPVPRQSRIPRIGHSSNRTRGNSDGAYSFGSKRLELWSWFESSLRLCLVFGQQLRRQIMKPARLRTLDTSVAWSTFNPIPRCLILAGGKMSRCWDRFVWKLYELDSVIRDFSCSTLMRSHRVRPGIVRTYKERYSSTISYPNVATGSRLNCIPRNSLFAIYSESNSLNKDRPLLLLLLKRNPLRYIKLCS